MTTERWQQVCDLLGQALELAPPQRPALLDQALYRLVYHQQESTVCYFAPPAYAAL